MYQIGPENWNLANKCTAFVGADALIGPQNNVPYFRNIPANSYPRTKGR